MSKNTSDIVLEVKGVSKRFGVRIHHLVFMVSNL